MQNQEPLTQREQEVLALVARGLTNKEIADHLVLSEYTVQNHLSNIFGKLGVSSRLQATLKVYKLVDPSSE